MVWQYYINQQFIDSFISLSCDWWLSKTIVENSMFINKHSFFNSRHSHFHPHILLHLPTPHHAVPWYKSFSAQKKTSAQHLSRITSRSSFYSWGNYASHESSRDQREVVRGRTARGKAVLSWLNKYAIIRVKRCSRKVALDRKNKGIDRSIGGSVIAGCYKLASSSCVICRGTRAARSIMPNLRDLWILRVFS